ncbi:hypothetical protein [Micromonospora sp. RTP1Z1]|uniref:hypothetical protein n=1 Tax=Micromonospora sp. RTP1Z1 TaxID=2994043 RepID=UPI0029C64239|nr:hypothetical protein [Micromonospora sp. RTP1Z1]
MLWPLLTLLVSLPLRWLFDRSEPLDELLLEAAFSGVWIGPVIALTRRTTQEQRRVVDPDGAALREALRRGTPLAEARLRAELPAHLRRQRQGALLGLALILAFCAGLILLALSTRSTASGAYWTVIYGLIAAISAVVAARTLTRRLKGHLTTRPAPVGEHPPTPGQRG